MPPARGFRTQTHDLQRALCELDGALRGFAPVVDRPRAWRITSSESERAQRRAAGFLRERGLDRGDRIAFACTSSPDLLAAVLAAVRVGVVPVVLNPALLPAELAALVADADPALVVNTPDELREVVTGPDRGVDLAPRPLARPMHYTSGTTGLPKGVWSGVLDEPDATALFDDERDVWGFASDDALLVCSPLHHSAPIRFSAGVLLCGGDVVLVERFDVDAVGAAIAEHAPTVAFMVPSHMRRLFDQSLPDLSSFRLLAHAGEPCPHALKERALETFPDGAVWEFYGSTEGQFTVCAPSEWIDHPGTVGRARRDRELIIGDDGEIWCRPPRWARFEYWRDPEKTAEAWRGDAFTVGDLGRLDDDGFLYIDGRRDDLIISGGVNVYPAEVEAAFVGLGGVDDVAVFGVADERWGQRVCVAVTGDVRDSDIHEAARRSLAPYKRPKDVYRVDALPRTGTGKVRRSAIAAALGLE